MISANFPPQAAGNSLGWKISFTESIPCPPEWMGRWGGLFLLFLSVFLFSVVQVFLLKKFLSTRGRADQIFRQKWTYLPWESINPLEDLKKCWAEKMWVVVWNAWNPWNMGGEIPRSETLWFFCCHVQDDALFCDIFFILTLKSLRNEWILVFDTFTSKTYEPTRLLLGSKSSTPPVRCFSNRAKLFFDTRVSSLYFLVSRVSSWFK